MSVIDLLQLTEVKVQVQPLFNKKENNVYIENSLQSNLAQRIQNQRKELR